MWACSSVTAPAVQHDCLLNNKLATLGKGEGGGGGGALHGVQVSKLLQRRTMLQDEVGVQLITNEKGLAEAEEGFLK